MGSAVCGLHGPGSPGSALCWPGPWKGAAGAKGRLQECVYTPVHSTLLYTTHSAVRLRPRSWAQDHKLHSELQHQSFFEILRQGLTKLPRMCLNLQRSCLSHLSSRDYRGPLSWLADFDFYKQKKKTRIFTSVKVSERICQDPATGCTGQENLSLASYIWKCTNVLPD